MNPVSSVIEFAEAPTGASFAITLKVIGPVAAGSAIVIALPLMFVAVPAGTIVTRV